VFFIVCTLNSSCSPAHNQTTRIKKINSSFIHVRYFFIVVEALNLWALIRTF
jgi:hypothetical protein